MHLTNRENGLPLVIAICGESGAGKTTTAELLKEMGFTPYSVSGQLRAAAEAAIDSPTRTQVQNFGRDRQREFGADYFARQLLEKEKPFANPPGVLDGMRNLTELAMLRETAQQEDVVFRLLALVTPDDVRFSRVVSRGRAGDPQSLDEFRALDQRATGTSEERFQENESLIRNADARITNTGTMDDLCRELTTRITEWT